MDLKKSSINGLKALKNMGNPISYKDIPNINIRFMAIFTMVVFAITLFFTIRNLFLFSSEYKNLVENQEKAILVSFVKNRSFTDTLASIKPGQISGAANENNFFSSMLSQFPNVLAAELFIIHPDSGEAISIDKYSSPQLAGKLNDFKNKLNKGQLSNNIFPTYKDDIVINGKFIGKVQIIFTRESCALFVSKMRSSTIINSIYMIFASLILGWLLSKMLTVPIETITANIDYIARGHHDEYITSSRIGPEGRLIASINNLMKSYNSKIDFALKDSQKTSVHLMNMLQTSCDKISQGLVIINTDNTVLLINDSFSKLFNLHKNECKNKHFYQIFNDKDAVAAIRDIRLKSYTNPDFFACSVLKMPFQDKTAKFNLAINSFSDSENRKLSILFFEFIGYEKA